LPEGFEPFRNPYQVEKDIIAAFEDLRERLLALPDFPEDVEITSAVNANDSVDVHLRIYVPVEVDNPTDIVFAINDFLTEYRTYKLYYTRLAGVTEFTAPDDPEGYRRRRGKYLVGTGYFNPRVDRRKIPMGWIKLSVVWRDMISSVLENEEGRRIVFLTLAAYWSDVGDLPGRGHERD